MMAAIAKWRDDMAGIAVTAGSSTAYTVTASQSYSANADGNTITVQMHVTNGASPTLNEGGHGAEAIRVATDTAVPAGTLLAGSIQRFTFNAADDCWYLEGYLPEPEDIIVATTKMLFQQTAAPTGWTKDTTHNDKALRVVSGTASSGGSVAFTTAFASQTPAGTVGGTAITEAQMPLHGHPYRIGTPGGPIDSDGGFALENNNPGNFGAYTGTPDDTAGHQIGGTGGGATHTHSFTGNAINLAVSYIDLIIATKD